MKQMFIQFIGLLLILLPMKALGQGGRSVQFQIERFNGVFKAQLALEGEEPVAGSNYYPTYIESALGKIVVLRVYAIEGLAELDSSNTQSIPNRFFNNYKIVFPDQCNSTNAPSILEYQNSSTPEILRRADKSFRPAELRYKISAYGRAKIFLGHAVVKHGTRADACADQQTTFEIVINPPTKSLNEQWEELQQEGVPGLCAYLSKKPPGPLSIRAEKAINAISEQDWTEAKNQYVAAKSKNDKNAQLGILNRFLDKYRVCQAQDLRAVRMAKDLKENLIGTPQKPTTKEEKKSSETTTEDENPELTLWQKAQNRGAIQAYNDYLDKYPQGKYARLANDSILRLSPITVDIQETEDGQIVLKFGNLINPGFEFDGPPVQHEINAAAKELTLHVPKTNGKYTLTVYDKAYPWKSSVQHFDHLFIPQLELGKDEFNVRFKEGVKPYTIELIDPNAILVWSQNNITSSSLTLSFRDLKRRNLSGEYQVRVRDSSEPPSTHDLGKIHIRQSYWWVFLLIIAALALTALIVVYAYRYSQKKDHNIFNT